MIRSQTNFLAACRLGLIAVALPGLLVAMGSCSRKIGDACSSSVDCDPNSGTRTCDLSQPGGYCVVEGCDARSCPEDSICVRFFPEPFLTNLATPCSADTDCDADELCLRDSETSGVCARRSWEKRVCVQSCGGDGDCRDGNYRCRQTGTPRSLGGIPGAIALTLHPDVKPRFCSPAD